MPILGGNDVRVTISTDADTSGIKEVNRNLSDIGNTSDDASGKTERLSGKFGNLAGSLSSVGSAIAGYGILNGLKQIGELAFGGAGQLEQTNMSFQNLIGNTQLANSVFAQLTQYANSTPFQNKDIQDAAKQLLAFGEGGKDVVGTIKQLGDVTAAGGGDLQALSLVTGQVFAQGKLRAQDMYQVINDGGAGLIKIMADNAGGMQKLTAEFDKGGIPAKQYFDAINQATGKGGFAFDGAQKQAETFNGKISTLKDSIQLFAMKIIGVHFDPQLGLVIDKGGLFDKAKGFIDSMTTALSKLAQNKIAVEIIAGALGGILLGSVIAVAVAIGWLPLAIVAVSAAIGAAVVVISSHWKQIKDFTVRIFIKPIIDAFKLEFAILKDVFMFVFNGMRDGARDVFNGIRGIWQGLVDVFRGIVNGVRDVFGGIADAIKSPFRSAFNFVADAWNNTVGRLSFKIPSWVPSLGGKGWDVPDIPHFSTGVRNFGGGLAVVGDVNGKGGEVVSLPAGSNVYSNRESKAMMGSTYNHYGDVYLGDSSAVAAYFAKIDRNNQLAQRGLTTAKA
jgi:phage-related protein